MTLKKRISIALLLMPFVAQAGLIPPGNNDFYYKIGGGQNIPLPANLSTQTVSLSVDGSTGFGYNCGLFNPALSITNSLNNLKNSFQNIQQTVIQNATAAVSQFPMYALSRADPALYNLINNGLLGARRDFNVASKNCQVMQSQISRGENPYQDWATLSMGNDWKWHMGSPLSLAANRGGEDIKDVKTQVEQDNGKNGLPWVQGVQTGRHELYAGGEGQPLIRVIYDTGIAGYNVLLQSGRRYNDTDTPVHTDANAHLVDTWANPIAAANWIATVVGDQAITTHAGGDKQSSPGIGLLPTVQSQSQELTQKLSALVKAQPSVTLEQLQEVSAPRVTVNQAVLQTLRQQNPVLQSIVVNKLAQEVATARIIDKAQLALQILESGSQVPVIYGNQSAQKTLQTALTRLHKAINDLLFNVKVNKALVSNTVGELMQANRAEQMNTTTLTTPNPASPALAQGAIPSNKP